MKIISLLLLFATTAILSHGQDYRKMANPTECRNALQAQHNSTSSLSAVFTERIYSSMYESSKKSNGKLLYKRSQKIRWEIVSPRKQVILINGNSIRINEEGKEVASNSSGAVAKKIQKMMINLISGDFLNEKDFAISYFENNLSYKLVLMPKNQSLSKYISSIVLIFDRKKMMLSEMSLIESETDKVVYSFTSVVVNQNINDNKFLSFE